MRAWPPMAVFFGMRGILANIRIETDQHSPADLLAENQSKLILSSRLALLIVILKNILATLECDSQQHILIP